MSLDQKKPAKSSPNRSYIRVSTASRLMAAHFHQSGRNLKGSSVIGCGRWKAYGHDPSIAEIEVNQNGAKFYGHFKCGSVWTCDQCARSRVSQTRSWIRAALVPALDGHGLSAAMMTFTMAHSYEGDWRVSIDLLHAAYKLFAKNMARRYKKIGCMGKLKCLEAPVGVHGIHGHFHVLLTHVLGADLSAFQALARAEWEKAVAQVGGVCNDHGFDFKLNAISDYLAKQELAHEISNHDTKKARRKGLLLVQLLDSAARGDSKASAEWLRAVEALQGRSRFHAGDIAKKLGIPTCTSWTDEVRQDESAEHSAEMPEPVRINYPLRDHLKATLTDSPRAGLAMILRAARGGNSEQTRRMVEALCRDASIRQKRAQHCSVPSFWDWPTDYFDQFLSPEGIQAAKNCVGSIHS